MKRYLKSSFLWIVILFFACSKEEQEGRKIIGLSAYNKVHVLDPLELYLIEGESYAAEIVGPEGDLDKIELSIQDSVLTIEDKRRLKWSNPKQEKVKIYLTSFALGELTAEGGAIIQTMNPITKNEFGLILTGKANEATLEIRSEGFYYWNNFPSGGKLTLIGQVNSLKLWNAALMAVDAEGLTTNYALVENASKGDISVRVLERLDYAISGEGDIQLYGNPPELNAGEQSSSGKLVQY